MSTPTAEIASLIHAGNPKDAALIVIDTFQLGTKLRDDNPQKYNPILLNYLHVMLEKGRPEEAASMLWNESQFTFKPQYTRDVWNLFETSSMGLIMGAGSCSKSFGMGVRLFLEWIRDPLWTSIKVLGPSQDHLESNLFSHLVSLHSSAALPMPGTVGELFIGADRRNQLGSIKGVVIPIGQVKKAGRLQGTKRKPRSGPAHPVFGALSRLFIFVDEGENVPGGLWSDIDNVLSNASEQGVSKGFKIFLAYNPTNREAEIGKRAEPKFGWEMFDPEKHFRWVSTRGWDVLRLDGERSENVTQDKVVFAGLQTRSGLERIALNSGGRNSSGYCSMGRGMYPPTGVELSIIPPGALAKWRGEFIWLDTPKPVAAADLALEGNASAKWTLGKWGLATGIKYPPSLEYPTGRTFMFKDRNNQVVPRWGLQAETQITLPRGDTRKMTDSIIDVNKRAGVRPEFFACDRTGNGAGVSDMIKTEWSGAIHDVNYSQSPTKLKIMVEDSKPCDEEYDRLNSELWYAMARFGEFGYLLLSPSLDIANLTPQLTNRKSKNAGAKKKVEAKRDYMSRGYESPDDADSLSLFVHAARLGSGVTLSMQGSSDINPEGEWDGWEDERAMRGGAYISSENVTDYIREDSRREEEIL